MAFFSLVRCGKFMVLTAAWWLAPLNALPAQGTSRDLKLFCLPNPLPTRNETLREFVQWARASQDRMMEAPTNGLVRFLAERFPCPKTR